MILLDMLKDSIGFYYTSNEAENKVTKWIAIIDQVENKQEDE